MRVVHRTGGHSLTCEANRYVPGMLSPWRPAAALASLALAFTLGACTQPSDAPTRPRASASQSIPAASPTADEQPSPTEPSFPPAATAADTAGAEAFARYAVDVLNHASSTGDVTRWGGITSPGCETCVSLSDEIEAVGPSDEGVVTIESARPTEIDSGKFYSVALKINQAPSTRADGSPDPGGRYALLFALQFTDGWRVEALDVAEPDAPWAG